jgi:hypothetical protein
VFISCDATVLTVFPVAWCCGPSDEAVRHRETLQNFINNKQIHNAWEWGKIKKQFFLFLTSYNLPHSLSFHSAADTNNTEDDAIQMDSSWIGKSDVRSEKFNYSHAFPL